MRDRFEGFDKSIPSPARMYDYYLGGKDNYYADREAADAVIAGQPDLPRLARANRGFLLRAVEFIAREGVEQFIDIGTGVPTSPNVHEVVRAVAPDARFAYVDNDPVVLAHDRALLATDEDIAVVDGDMFDPEGILADEVLQRTIDFSRPVAVLFVAVLHFSKDRPPKDLVAPFRALMVPGSYIAASHITSDGLTVEEVAAIEGPYEKTPRGVKLRSREGIEPIFDGFDLVEPGLVDVADWRGFEARTHLRVLAAVGRRGDNQL